MLFSPSQQDRQDSRAGASPNNVPACLTAVCVCVRLCVSQHACIFGQEKEGVREFVAVEWLGENRDEADAVSQLGQTNCAMRQRPLAWD